MEVYSIYELPHDKTNKMTRTPSKDSDQPGHLPSLIRIFAVCSMGSLGPKLSSCGQRRLIRLGACPGLSESLLGAQVILLVLSCVDSYISCKWLWLSYHQSEHSVGV